MGMTIAEPIQTLEYLKDSGVFPFSTVDEVLYTVESIDVAIDTMRKYQKIQEIVSWNNAPSPYYKPDGQLFREICEVLEDGNDDN